MRREWIIYLALLVITAVVYWPVGHYGFVNCDDPDYVSANPHVQQGLTPAGVVWAFRAVVASNWHPVTCLSLMLDSQLFGKNAGAHHFVNLLFHLANTLLLFLVWRRMTGEIWPSALVAALFAWHPLHVESVAWISERKDVLSTFFGLLTIWAYTRYAQRQQSVESPESRAKKCAPSAKQKQPSMLDPRPSTLSALDPRRWTLDYYTALLFFALGLMSKPMLVTWPCVLLLLDFWPLGRMTSDQWRVTGLRIPVPQLSSLKLLLLEKLPFFALATASSLVTFFAQRAAGTMELLPLSISERAGNALVSYVRYLGKMFWPEHLAFFYPYPGRWIVHAQAWTEWQVTGSAMLLALVTAMAIGQARRRPYLIVGWLWFLGTLVPVIGLVQVGAQSIADRYTYLPLIGVFVMLVWGGKELVGRWPHAKFTAAAIVAVLLAACLVVTSRQLRYWRNSETLCRHAIAVTANNYKAYFNLGSALLEEDKTDAAIRQLYAAAAIAPGFNGRKVLAEALVRQGRIPEAIEQFRQMLRYNPDQPEALNNLAYMLATDKDPKIRNGAEAVPFGERACELTHYKVTVYVGTLAAAYAEAGRFDDAIRTAETAIASAKAAGETNLLKKNQQLLELYRAGQPYHEGTKL